VSLPWGDGYTPNENDPNGNAQDNLHFAQIDHDTESNTEHAQFRQYSSAQGRWLSPDPYDGSYDPTNPQSFDRYAYVLNSPLSATDPMGLDDCDGCSEGDTTGDDGGGGGPAPSGGEYDPPPSSGSGDTPVNQGNAPTIKGPGLTIWLNSYLSTGLIQGIGSYGGISQIPTLTFGGGGATPKKPKQNGCMVANGRTVCPSPIDKYNFLHPGQTNYRDSNSQCSQHTTVNNATGQVQSHIDEFNPNYYFVNHVILDVIPDVIYDITGSYLFPTGNQFCPQ
jgi:RHS repeat-associated protein